MLPMVLVRYVQPLRNYSLRNVVLICQSFHPRYSTVVAGTKWPIFAAAACGTWVVARVVYTIGYSTGNPDKVCYPRMSNFPLKID